MFEFNLLFLYTSINGAVSKQCIGAKEWGSFQSNH